MYTLEGVSSIANFITAYEESQKYRDSHFLICSVFFFFPRAIFLTFITLLRSMAVVPVLVLLFVALWFILRGDLFCLTLCHFVLVFFSPFSIAITSLEEEGANLSAFLTFVRFVLVCRFPLPLEVWEGLRCVIVALSGLFSYPFLRNC